MTTLLIDSDLVAFRCAASVGEDAKDVALSRVDRLMQELLHLTGASDYIAFLTGPGNFRKKINLEYKANRKDKEPPIYLKDCREFLINEWNAVVSEGIEADDLLGIYQTDKTIIASLDKDLRMIEGHHYNWMHNVRDYVSELDGLRHFYKQMLIGDRSDNIFGVDKIGPVKAGKLIDNLEDEMEMIDVVANLYNDPKRFVMNAQCLWIMQQEGVTWVKRNLTLPNLLQQEAAIMSDSMTSLIKDISMVPTTTPPTTFGIPSNGVTPECMEPEVVPLT